MRAHQHGDGLVGEVESWCRARRRAGVAMVAALVFAGLVFVVLAAAAPAQTALRVAAGVAVVLCLVVCVVAGVANSRAVAEVERATERFREQRRRPR